MSRVQVVVFATCESFTPVLCAQSPNASLAGRVIDPSKAMIADARIGRGGPLRRAGAVPGAQFPKRNRSSGVMPLMVLALGY